MSKNITVRPKSSPIETAPTVTPLPSRHQSDEKSKAINLSEDGTGHPKPSTAKTKLIETSIQFRSQPGKLDKSEVEDLIRNYDFYDTFINPKGKGLSHRYAAIKLDDDEIVIDEVTNLIWQQNGSAEYMNFENAKKWLEKLNRERYAGFQDWRFPTLEEAMSLMEAERKNNNLYIDPLFRKTQDVIWTGDFQKGESKMWIVSFSSGFCGLSTLYSYDFVRAVRHDENFRNNLII